MGYVAGCSTAPFLRLFCPEILASSANVRKAPELVCVVSAPEPRDAQTVQ